MRVVPFRSVLWLGGAIALAASVAMTLTTLRDIKEGAGRLARKAGDLSELRRLGESGAEYRAAQRAFDQLDDQVTRTRFEPVILRALPARKPEDMRRRRESLRPGWVVEHVEIYLTELPFKELGPLLEAAESLRPPWRLTKCVLSGSPRAAGSGRATLQFERICRE